MSSDCGTLSESEGEASPLVSFNDQLQIPQQHRSAVYHTPSMSGTKRLSSPITHHSQSGVMDGHDNFPTHVSGHAVETCSSSQQPLAYLSEQFEGNALGLNMHHMPNFHDHQDREREFDNHPHPAQPSDLVMAMFENEIQPMGFVAGPPGDSHHASPFEGHSMMDLDNFVFDLKDYEDALADLGELYGDVV